MSIRSCGLNGAIDSAGRRRDTVLAALEAFRSVDRGVTVSNILAFLYVAENEGISISELAAVAALNKPSASRSVRALAVKGARWARSPYLGLVEVCAQGPARNSKTLRLTTEGVALRERLDDLIRACTPIALNPQHEWPASPRNAESPEAREPVQTVKHDG